MNMMEVVDNVHVEVPNGSTLPMLEVPVTALPTLTDEQDLFLVPGTWPGLPHLHIYTLVTDSTEPNAIPVHAEIPPNSNVALLEMAEATGITDEENLSVFSNVPGALLVMYRLDTP